VQGREPPGGCPAWCTADHSPGRRSLEHASDAVLLADTEDGRGCFMARLVSAANEPDAFRLAVSLVSVDWSVRLPLVTADNLMAALDDGGRAAMQRCAGIVARGRT